MSCEKFSRVLVGDTPGRSTELNWFRVGPPDAQKKVYLQAALHADEQPGILVLHHLLGLLQAADAAGQLHARFVLFPMVNPLGMGDIEFGRHQGRYNRASGVNHNRGWPNLYEAVVGDVGDRLGDDADANVGLVRAALRERIAQMPEVSAFEQWRKTLLGEACDADYVFDVHCDDDSLIHIFSVPQLEPTMRRLANRVGAAATLLCEDSGGASFDEIWPAIWLGLQRAQPDRPLPLPVAACTLEFRGQFDTFDALNRGDAENLFAYFQDEGLIGGDAPQAAAEAPAPTDLRATEFLRAPDSGLLVYRVQLGQRVARGEPVADLLRLDGGGAFTERVPIVAGTDGIVLSRATLKYAWRKANVAKIVGSEIIAAADSYLLSD
jgi:predicted deacylase